MLERFWSVLGFCKNGEVFYTVVCEFTNQFKLILKSDVQKISTWLMIFNNHCQFVLKTLIFVLIMLFASTVSF